MPAPEILLESRPADTGSGVWLPVSPIELNLAVTLDCGQCFRFRQEPGGTFSGVAFGRVLRLSQTENGICLHGAPAKEADVIWRNWLDFSTPYEEIKEFLSSGDSVMREAIAFAPGIHILRQEPFEALMSFIISQNNNIPRIRSSIERLCRAFGAPLGQDCYAFPTPEALASLSREDLAPIGLGYRDDYLLGCARRIADGRLDLHMVEHMELEKAREALLEVKGVGVKVAECALLFGFHRLDAFPVDTWMKKALTEFYPGGFPARFAPVAGIAQQYLFHYIRSRSPKEKRDIQ